MPSGTCTLRSSSPDETKKIARKLAEKLQPGDALSLMGELGSGKTTFVQGLVEGLGGDPSDVSSPSFTIYTVYETPRFSVYHVDLYRLSCSDPDVEREVEEALANGAVAVIEWAERWREIVKKSRYVIKFSMQTERERVIEIHERS